MNSHITPRHLLPIRRAVLLGGALIASLAILPAPAAAQSRHQHRDSGREQRAAPRGSVRTQRPVVIAPSRPYYRPVYRPSVNLGFFYGYPGYYGAYRYGRPAYGYYGDLYPYGWVAPYGYAYDGYSGRAYGGVRIDLPQRDAEVYVDGYFVGIVDDFDGALQQANLEAGPHRVEVRDPDFETIAFDVNVEPGRTITYRASMRPLRP